MVDTSAVIAILLQEDDARRFADTIAAADPPLISAASVVEAGLVLIRREGPAARADLREFLERGGFRIEPVTTEQSDLALDAYQRYGKGCGKPAVLNYGDCFAYALARAMGKPLLFKGDDFSQTDIPKA